MKQTITDSNLLQYSKEILDFLNTKKNLDTYGKTVVLKCVLVAINNFSIAGIGLTEKK